MSNESVRIILSKEELVLLLWYLRIPTLPGLGRNPFGEDVSNETVIGELTSAEHALRARGFISVNEDGDVSVEQILVAVLGSCATPDMAVILSHLNTAGERDVRHYYFTKHLMICHSSPETDIHHFVVYETVDDLMQAMVEHTRLESQGKPSGAEFVLSQDALQSCTEQVRSGQTDTAKESLLAQGLKDQTVTEFIQTLQEPVSNTSAIVIHTEDDETAKSENFSIVEGSNGLWKMTATLNDLTQLQFEPFSPDEVRETFLDVLAPYA